METDKRENQQQKLAANQYWLTVLLGLSEQIKNVTLFARHGTEDKSVAAERSSAIMLVTVRLVSDLLLGIMPEFYTISH